MPVDNIFYQTALVLAISAGIGAIALKLRQPLIVSFIAVGILVGPSGIGLVAADEHIRFLAEIGIALLLFAVGLKLDLHLVRTMGAVALATGIGQVLFTSLLGFLIAVGLGFSFIAAAYVAVALTFSSTIIIVKLLSDKREIDALHGRIAIGFLIVQDIAVVLAMVLLTAIGAGEASGRLWIEISLVFLKGGVLLAGLVVVTRFILPLILPLLARTQELLIISAIAWAVLLATFGDWLDFSKEIGAFLAGVTLASTPYRESIISRLVSLRDFLLLFFFINLGAQIDLSTLGSQVVPALIFSAFVLVGNPLIVMAIMGYMGYRKRTGFLAGLTVAQISEFSLILAALGVSLGHIGRETLGLITLVGLITIGLSTYMILYSHRLYAALAPLLSIFERRNPFREARKDARDGTGRVDVILFGLGRYGRNIAENLVRRGRRVLAVDFDPEVVAGRPMGIPVVYGDVEDPEILDHLPLAQARWIVNATPGRDANLSLLREVREKKLPVKVVLTAHHQADADIYFEAGADKILRPFADAAEQAVDYLTAIKDEIAAQTPWPVALEEIRVRPDFLASGKKLGDLALPARTGATVIAVNRAGRSQFDLGPNFTIFPGDRLVLLGSEESVKLARNVLEEPRALAEEERQFQVKELLLDADSGLADRSIAALDFRGKYGLSVIGIRRGEEKIISPGPEENVRAGDSLLLLGSPEAIARLEREKADEGLSG